MKGLPKWVIVSCLLAIVSSITAAQAGQKIGSRLSAVLTASEDDEQIMAWVFFTDKGLYESMRSSVPRTVVSERSIRRRLKVRTANEVVDYTDLPVESRYVDELSRHVMRIRQRSKWFNAASIVATKAQIVALESLPFVKEIEVAHRARTNRELEQENSPSVVRSIDSEGGDRTTDLNYGSSLNQNQQINVVAVHNTGNYAQGVLVGVFDNGFRLLTHQAFDTLRPRIVATYDWVDHKVSVVPNNPSTAFGSHGVNTLSTIGGYRDGQLIGPAWGATYILARTENDSSETPIEEDNWVAAIEWADSIGVEVTSTSLGYLGYDPPYTSWTWQDMNGRTTVITRAAAMAVRWGIIVCNSAGNSGYNASHNTLGAPADGDSVMAIGAVTSTGTISSFSSCGPTTATPPRIKPDVCAQGSSVRVASALNVSSYTTASGTSFSCPLAAGVAALIVKAHPYASNIRITNAMRMTASRASLPDNQYGWGILNAQAAIAYLDRTPVAHYSFDGHANDSSVSGNHGTTSGATLTADRFGNAGKAYDFNGSSNYVDLPESPSLTSFGDRISISGWLCLRSYPAAGSATPLISSGNQNDYFVGVGSDGRLYSHLYLSSGPGAMIGKNTVPLNQWVHIALTYDGSIVRLYFNGDPDSSFIRSGTVGGSPQAENIAIGAQFYGGSFGVFTDGKMDDIRIYNSVLPDSVIQQLYREGGYCTGQYPVSAAWNLVSVPLSVADARKTVLFPTAISDAYAFGPSGYVVQDTLQDGVGYWLSFPSAQSIGIAGVERAKDTVTLSAGWNMIGTISDSVPTGAIQQIPPDNIASEFYGYSAGYSAETILVPSRGYWVRTLAAGVLVLGSGLDLHKGALAERYSLERAASITVTDVLDAKQTLYVAAEPLEGRELAQFELPPLPPAGVFDARFSTQRMLEAVQAGQSKTLPIQLSSAGYPLTIRWDTKDQQLTASLLVGAREVPLNAAGSISVTDPEATLALKLGGQLALPKEFALLQNYPNPFNPTTTIRYDLPRDTRVSLKLFNILGQEVATLVNEEQKAGYRSVKWNAGNVASGVYLYRIQAGTFVASRKLLLVK